MRVLCLVLLFAVFLRWNRNGCSAGLCTGPIAEEALDGKGLVALPFSMMTTAEELAARVSRSLSAGRTGNILTDSGPHPKASNDTATWRRKVETTQIPQQHFLYWA